MAFIVQKHGLNFVEIFHRSGRKKLYFRAQSQIFMISLKVAVSRDFLEFIFYETYTPGLLINRLNGFAERFVFAEIFTK